MLIITISGDILQINTAITKAVITAADELTPRSKNRMRKKLVPRWTEDCRQAIRDRNTAFRQVQSTDNMLHLIQYKKAQAEVRRTIHQGKRASWQNFCNKIGRATPRNSSLQQGQGREHSEKRKLFRRGENVEGKTSESASRRVKQEGSNR